MIDKAQKLKAAWDAAFECYALTMNELFSFEALFEIIPSQGFIAQVSTTNNAVKVSISTGVLDILTNLWLKALPNSATRSDDNQLNTGNINQVIDTSLVWLMLHELYHLQMNHIEMIDADQISKTPSGQLFSLVSHANKPTSLIPDLDHIKLERCLELQADHEAIDMLLESYSIHEWEELRRRIVCISAVMVLIDVEDIKRNSKQTSHPKAATRIFQMLGHVCELPLIPAQARALADSKPINQDAILSEEEQQAFVKQVAIPAFNDAIDLAKAADAEYIINQLGDLPTFFDDVYLAKTNSEAGLDQFKTQGAIEWCQLKPINERILKLQSELGLI